jgi:HAD superfamily hydrolase (TIGR01509 family)
MVASAGLIIFDCDGVLVDSEPIAMQILLATVSEAGGNIDAATAHEAFLGKSLTTICDQLSREHGLDLGAAALEQMRKRLYRAIRADLRPIPGIDYALRNLEHPVCVASSSQPERICLSLETTGLSAFFAGNVFSASMVDCGKPAPDLFLHAARNMGVEPSRCIVVEDSPAGIAAAVSAGMTAFGFTGGSHTNSKADARKLERLGARLVFDDMHQLPRLVRDARLDENLP